MRMAFLGEKAFTLLEVLLAAVILSAGISLVIPVLFKAGDVTVHLGNRLEVMAYMDECIWEAREYLSENPGPVEFLREKGRTDGLSVTIRTRIFPENDIDRLYRIELDAEWTERGNGKRLNRELLVIR